MSRSDDIAVAPGDVLSGKYRVERVLGEGAMGVVVAAMHVELGERRAIKIMRASMQADAESVERFLREARAAVRLKSQHVAKVHDTGRLDSGAPYMVMEHLVGGDLKHVLEERGPLPVREAVTYMMQACEAIAEAHAAGIIHRDLKPANLFVTTGPSGAPCVKVLDFGIAKITDAQGGLDVTRTSALLGTPLYMSPEQMRGAKNVDGRSDVWALGAILYRMLTNKTPFTGSTVTEICASVVSDDPDPPAKLRPEVPPGLDAAVMRCLEKSPSKRFSTAAELSAAIAPFAVDAPHAVAPASSGLRPALAGTAIMDPSYAAPVPVSPSAMARPAPPLPMSTVLVAAPPMMAAAPAPLPFAPPSIAAAPPPIAAPPPTAAIATGNSTARASAWSSGEAAPAKRSSAGLFAVVGALAIAAIGAAVVGVRALAKPIEGGAVTPSSAPAAKPSVEPTVAPTAAPAPDASAAPRAAETSAPIVSAAASAIAAPPVKPQARAPVAPLKPKSRDAFGSDRK